jgi:hypothetical protein
MSTIKHMVGGHLFSQTGAELFGWDHFSEEDPRCLLEVMTDPSEYYNDEYAGCCVVHTE